MKIILNPDKDFVKEIKAQLKSNNGYCPCAVVKNKDTKCMCKNFREQTKRNEPGMCHCGLYIAEAEGDN